MVFKPANFDARKRRSPDTNWYLFPFILRTVTGCMTPNCFIDVLNSFIDSSLKCVRGWNGLLLIFSMGKSIILPMISSALLSSMDSIL